MSEENKELIIEEVEIKGKKRKINLEKYAKNSFLIRTSLRN